MREGGNPNEHRSIVIDPEQEAAFGPWGWGGGGGGVGGPMLILENGNVSWFVASVAYSGLDLGGGAGGGYFEPNLYSFNVLLTPRPPLHIPGLLPCYAYSCHMSKLRKIPMCRVTYFYRHVVALVAMPKQ